MTIQFLRAWNGYEQSQIETLAGAEETRLIGLGLARDYTPYMDGARSTVDLVGHVDPVTGAPTIVTQKADGTQVQTSVSGGGVSAWSDLTDKATADLPVDNAPLAAALAALVGGAPTNVVYVDTTGVTATTGDISVPLAAAINAADNGAGVPPDKVMIPPGKWRLRTNCTITDKSVDLDGQGSVLVVDPFQSVGTTDFKVASTAGWPASGTFSVTDASAVTHTVTYTSLATSPTRFAGCTGWTGSTGLLEQGALVTNGTQTTTANAESSVVSSDSFVLYATLGSAVAVTAVGGARQTGAIPELYVNSTSAFAASGTVTVTLSDASTVVVTYTGKTAYSFLGCTGASGVILAGAVVTDGGNTTYTIQSKYGYPAATTLINGALAANSGTLVVDDTSDFPSTGALRILSSTSVEVITYTGKTAVSFTGCTGGTAATFADNAVVFYDGNTSAGTRESFGTRIYCSTTGLAYGDVVKILSNDILNPVAFNAEGTGAVEMQAEFGKIMAVNTVDGYIVIDRELYCDYINTPRLTKLQSNRSVSIKNLFATYAIPEPKKVVNLGGYRGFLSAEGFVNPKFDHIGVDHLPGPNLSLKNCYFPQIGTLSCLHQLGDTSLNQVGYGLNVASTQGGGCKMIWAERCRHVFTTNANDNTRATNADVRNYGGVTDFHVETMVATNCESFAWDTHTDAINVTGGRVIVRGDFQPRSEQMGAVQFRGWKHCGIDHIHYDGPGYALLCQGDIGAVDFYVNKITGAHHYTMRGGNGTTERNTTTINGGISLPTGTVTVASTTNFATAGTFDVSTTTNGTQRVTYTGKTGTTFTGCTGGTGTVANSALVFRIVEPNARLKIGEIDVTATGGTTQIRFTRNGTFEIGSVKVRYEPAKYKPQSSLGHTVFSYATAGGDPEHCRVKIGKIAVDVSSYPSQAMMPVGINIFALATLSSTQQYQYNRFDIGEIEIENGDGMSTGYAISGTMKLSIFGGTGVSMNGVNVGKINVLQGGVAANTFVPGFFTSAATGVLARIAGLIRGSGASQQIIGDYNVSYSSATTTLTHCGANYTLASNTVLGMEQMLRARCTVTNAAGKITTLQAPAYDGQMWEISCVAASANPVVIAQSQISGAGADQTVAAGQRVILTAVGGAWTKYTLV